MTGQSLSSGSQNTQLWSPRPAPELGRRESRCGHMTDGPGWRGGKLDGSGGGEALPAHSQTSNGHAVRSDPEKDACTQPGRRHAHGQTTDTRTQSDHRQRAQKPSHTYSHSQATEGAACKIRRIKLAQSPTTHADRHKIRPRRHREQSDQGPETHSQTRCPHGRRSGRRRGCTAGLQATPRGDRAEVCGACRPAGQIPSPTDACRRRRAQTTDARQAQPAADCAVGMLVTRAQPSSGPPRWAL